MIRPASHADLARLNELVHQMHRESIYSDERLREATIRSLLIDGVRRHGGRHAGSTLFNVIEFRGAVEGFMYGLLQPLYHIGERLEAMDFWLYSTKKAPFIGSSRLVDAYTEWAANNPQVRDIKLSWTDAMRVKGPKIEKLFRRKGFVSCGSIYRKGE